ncbi:MAG TPA: hypothetical protein VFP22_11400, partial [Candidatus Limnocylindrales bacterium]|nr:hypothetical protein [Candidatus Limnocylindrales bacterium]
KIREKYGDEMKAAFKDKDREKTTALFKKIGEETTKALTDVLKPEQLKRVKQIEVQLGGLAVLTREDVAKTLSLTEKQLADAKTVQDAYNTGIPEIPIYYRSETTGLSVHVGGWPGYNPSSIGPTWNVENWWFKP